MVITYSVILIGLLFLIRPLQKNSFYILHAALVILAIGVIIKRRVF